MQDEAEQIFLRIKHFCRDISRATRLKTEASTGMRPNPTTA
jgi:hypothetical protein